MDANDIAYASVLVAKDAANSAFWTMVVGFLSAIASIISAGVTVAAAVLAFKTMHAWKHQEEYKDKKELKAALVYYRNKLAYMPNSLFFNNPGRVKICETLEEAANKVYLPLVVLEEDLEKGLLGVRVNEFLKLHYDYLDGSATRDDLAMCLSNLLTMKILHINK